MVQQLEASTIDGKSSHARIHINRACEPCRSRKIRCNGRHPCHKCEQHQRQCQYRAGGARKKRDRVREDTPKEIELNPSSIEAEQTAGPADPVPPQPQVFSDLVQFKLHQALRVGIGVSNQATGSFQFYGPSSHFCFIQRIYERVKRNCHPAELPQRDSTVPEALEKWGLEKFMFSREYVHGGNPPLQADAYFPRDMGVLFIEAYFRIMHPQMPLLAYSEIMETWNKLWEPPQPGKVLKDADLLYMVLAIGSRVSNYKGKQTAEWVDLWAEHFSNKANNFALYFQEPSLKGTHFMLLKAMYALQVMRPNEAYLYFGYAARNVLALGINRSQVTDGNNLSMHRLRITFWTIFANEKISALFIGRPSSLCEDQVDTACPEDIFPQNVTGMDSDSPEHIRPTVECAWIRAAAKIGRVADKVSIATYSPNCMRDISDVEKSEQLVIECDARLKSIAQSLPPYLHFYDHSLPIGESWQEVQRVSLGLIYYLTCMLMHRPSLMYATFFSSTAEAESNATGPLKIKDSIDASINAARSLIDLAHDVYFRRFPEIRSDGTMATFLTSACITLLYDVLDPRTTQEHAKATFATVERGIQCLDEIQHVGPLTGKLISTDIMKMAKDALISMGNSFGTDSNIFDSFPWLLDVQDSYDPIPLASSSYLPATTANSGVFVPNANEMGLASSTPSTNLRSYWVENGFDPQNVPESLF
ncbi:hypothetical protein ANOM_002854 [Aspergillus nomiae NRRL 13137]|uniref:Zn(2)-C6 fungal-type domain-containing protein n=1 Tax=Aspergillus nomiae NRRL (strain ATCC 15546 / NRRL 13137 / CBS 260.88 / M93) TaxID=1509407 RepID=A0A0L1JDD6_ASPN3|nr:uncharacterized protein ANOM_002854 [Aspergillus nomiae NRRL 13137]KNG89799.1 hypothetical protein ANOM_002854 [Aspergillus nomiae NRRL 13137]